MRAALESLLRARKLDVTLTALTAAGEPLLAATGERRAAPTGIAALDTALGGGFGLVVFELAGVAAAALRRFPVTAWMRLSRIVEGSDTVALLVGAEHLARSAGGVTIACASPAAAWQGGAHRARLFTGLTALPRVMGGRL